MLPLLAFQTLIALAQKMRQLTKTCNSKISKQMPKGSPDSEHVDNDKTKLIIPPNTTKEIVRGATSKPSPKP